MNQWTLLSALRFWLALIVAVNHLAEYAELGWLSVIPKLGAFEAVLGFLVVSGYSIAASHHAAPAGFYRRRAARVYPVYVAAIALTFAVAPVRIDPDFLGTLALNLLFLNHAVTSTSYVGPAWSLSLEVWLYALTPLLARCREDVVRRLIYVSLAAFSIYTVGRSALHWPYYAGQGYLLNLLTLGFAWLCGWHVHRAQSSGAGLRVLAGAFAAHWGLSVALQVVYRILNSKTGLIPSDLLDLALRGSTLVVVWACFWWIQSGRALHAGRGVQTALRWLGDVSYPLFLMHIPVYVALRGLGVVGAEGMLLGAIVVAALAHQLLEVRWWAAKSTRAES